MEASTDSEIADLFAEFFQTTYGSAAWSNSNYPNPLNKANCIFTPEITEISLVRKQRQLILPVLMDSPGVCLSFVRQPYVNRFSNFFICLFHRQFFLLSGRTLLSFHFTKRVRKADAQNYRGISKLSAIPKAFERINTSHLQHL